MAQRRCDWQFYNNVALAPGDHPGSRRIDLPGPVRLENIHQALALHAHWVPNAADLEERWREIHQDGEIVHYATGLDARPTRDQRNAHAKVVKVALAGGEARDAVIAANNEQRVIQLAGILVFFATIGALAMPLVSSVLVIVGALAMAGKGAEAALVFGVQVFLGVGLTSFAWQFLKRRWRR